MINLEKYYKSFSGLMAHICYNKGKRWNLKKGG